MRRLLVLLAVFAFTASGCGGSGRAPAPAVTDLPGRAVDAERFDASGQGLAIARIHELAATGHGLHRHRLFGGRDGAGRLCLTELEGTFANGSGGLFHCHDERAAPPLLAYAAWGPSGGPAAQFSFVGLVHEDVARVAVHVRGARELELPLTRWAESSWASFAGTVSAWPEFLSAYDPVGDLLSRIDLTRRIAPCPGRCTADLLLPLVPELTRQQRASFRRLALADRFVGRLLAGRRYVVSSVAPWYDCQDRIFAVTTTVRLAEPAEFEADWPSAEFDAGKKTRPPYWEAVAHFRVTGLRELEITVDVETRKLVGVLPGIEGDPRWSRFRMVEAPPREGIDCNGSSSD